MRVFALGHGVGQPGEEDIEVFDARRDLFGVCRFKLPEGDGDALGSTSDVQKSSVSEWPLMDWAKWPSSCGTSRLLKISANWPSGVRPSVPAAAHPVRRSCTKGGISDQRERWTDLSLK